MRPVSKQHLLVAALYALSAAFLTWPLVAHLGDSYPSSVFWIGGDPNMYIWYMDWVAKALTGRLPTAASQMLYFPSGISPLGGYDGPLMLLIGVPVNLLFGNPVLAYDLFVLAALAGSAWAAYLLAWRLTESRYAAVIAGFLFGFSPYLLVRATQHPNLLMIGTLPLLVLATLEFCRVPDRRRTAWLGVAAFANALSSWYYAIGGLVFVGIILLFHAREWRRRLPQLAAGLAALGLATALPALPMLFSPTHGGQPFSDGFVRQVGARPINFILPHPMTDVFGRLTAATYEGLPREDLTMPYMLEYTSYFGFPLLLLVAAFVIKRRRFAASRPWLWITGGLVGTVLAMGMELRVGDWRLPLPFALLRHLFPFSLARVPNRFFVVALLCAAVMAAFVLADWHGRQKKRFTVVAATALLGLVLLAERWIFPFPLMKPTVPEFYRRVAADRENYAIAELPNAYPGYSEYDFYQTVHGKPITGGEFFYPSYGPATFAYVTGNPLLAAGICRRDESVVRPQPDLERDVWPDFRRQGVRYVVVHNLIMHNEPYCSGAQRAVRQAFRGVTPYFNDGEITVYRVPPAP